VPPSLRGLEERAEHYEPLGLGYEAFRDLLRERYTPR